MKRETPNSPKGVEGHKKDRTDYSSSVGFKTMLKYNRFCYILFRDGTIFLFIFLLLIPSVKRETQMDKRSVTSIGSAKWKKTIRLFCDSPQKHPGVESGMPFFDVLQAILNMMRYYIMSEDLRKVKRNRFHPGQPISKSFGIPEGPR